ncbi:MAG: RecQ family ATP-dependent DNA helicase [Bryobacteraceae bacterium]
MDPLDLLAPLRRYWGYDSFRPMQEQIVRSLIGGRDVAVVMPTGGGKSLCYQLPALVLGKTAVVVSPLIALMQDQAAQLAQMGIPAAVLNSALPWPEQAQVMRRARTGEYRLLYLSPERLAREDTVGWLSEVPVAFFAIDEAHCISEWGHEFRPEYRQLNRLREAFPRMPIAAFTASATRRVRHDILGQLQLREPHKYIASFQRRNLRYLVRLCDAKTQPRLLVRALRANNSGSVIVYAPTIARVEDTVDFLAEKGIEAVAYHGQMDAAERLRNQERWMSDEVRALVGTIAFGLGINKPSVRAVIHLSLPKSIEQFYQEAGRAGRDGDPADCLLLWQKKDAGLLAYFIEEIRDASEKSRAWDRYHTVRRFVETPVCRHRQICLHFGETPKWEGCGNCDVCAALPEWMTDERPRKSELPRPETAFDVALREYMRQWRREAARRRGVPAFMVLSDAALDDLCRRKPDNLRGLLKVSGIGEKKAELFGQEIFAALGAFQSGARATTSTARQATPEEETRALLREGCSLEEIARRRGRRMATVVEQVAGLVEQKAVPFQPSWVDADKRLQIEEACARLGTEKLKALTDALPPEVTREELRLVVADVRSRLKSS